MTLHSHEKSRPSPSRRDFAAIALGVASVSVIGVGAADAATASELDRDASEALRRLYASSPQARQLAARSRAILVFPRITKGGFMFGGQGGQGVLRVRGRTAGYYSIYAGSFGLQAGIQTFSYALFFITQSALNKVESADGWAIGSDPNVVVVDQGAAANLNTTTLKKEIYAMPFGQKGLMAGISLEGSKITRIHPKP